MIISFSNLGGGGGGSYVLPVATASRLGGVKIGSGLTITNDGVLSSEGGGSDPNAQHWFTAATVSDMDSLTGVSEGDVCVVLGHWEDINTNDPYAYDKFCRGLPIYDVISPFETVIQFNVIENPSYIPEYNQPNPSGSSMYWIVTDEYSNRHYYGIRCNIEGVWQYLEDGSDPTDDTQWLTMPESGVTFDFGFMYNAMDYSSNNTLYLFTNYIDYTNEAYEHSLAIYTFVSNKTYQKNNGVWIGLANSDDVNNALSTANDALYTAYDALYDASQKLQSFYGYTYNDWTDIENSVPCLYEDLYIDGVNEGTRLHARGAGEEINNPKVTEIMTNRNPGVVPATLRVVSLNQNEYDALVLGGTTSDNTLYIIVDDTKWQS